MNIITEPFVNDINLAICVFQPDTLQHDELTNRMMEYTTFYALRFNQLIKEGTSPIDIYHAETIESGLHDLADKHDHIILMAAGARILDMSIIFDIKSIIENNDNYLAAAHILDWKANWYELHHQFILVNSKKWIAAGSPNYGGWDSKIEELPEVDRSVENFHDDYTPLWIKFKGTYTTQHHQKQGWNFINKAARNNYDIINWEQSIRSKRTYYYPEDHSQEFLESIKTLTVAGITNPNQKNLISQCKSIANQIWLLNSENMDLELTGENFDTVALPAAGFKFLDVIKSGLLEENGKIVIYDFNEKSVNWIKYIYNNPSLSIEDLVRTYEHRETFKFFGNKVFSKDGIFTKEFVDSLAVTQNFFGGKAKFLEYLEIFRKTNVEFLHTDIIGAPETLANSLTGAAAINISNIFCTDFSNLVWGMTETTKKLKSFISLLPSGTTVVGQDSYCRPIKKKIVKEL